MVIGGLCFTLIKSFVPIFYEEAKVLSRILQKTKELRLNDCDISVPVSMATMEMIGRTSIGVKFNAQNSSTQHLFVTNLNTVMHVSKNYKIA